MNKLTFERTACRDPAGGRHRKRYAASREASPLSSRARNVGREMPANRRASRRSYNSFSLPRVSLDFGFFSPLARMTQMPPYERRENLPWQPITRYRAHGSLWPSVTVYSLRSYFAPVVLKKGQSTRDKYARVRRWRARCNVSPMCHDSCRNSDKYLPSLFSPAE
jgi:hypothetical protein